MARADEPLTQRELDLLTRIDRQADEAKRLAEDVLALPREHDDPASGELARAQAGCEALALGYRFLHAAVLTGRERAKRNR